MFLDLINILIIVLICYITGAIFPRLKRFPSLKSIKEDASWFFINEIAYNFTVNLIAIKVGHLISLEIVPNDAFLFLQKLSPVSQGIIFFLIIDFVSYWSHYILHSNKYLWKIHELHHSTKELTPLSAFRHSIFERMFHANIFGMVSLLLPIDPNIKNNVLYVFTISCIVQHTSIDSKLFPSFLKYFIITPHCHFYHHSLRQFYRYGQNFGFILPWWDMLFKTFYTSKDINIEIGLANKEFPNKILEQIIYPLNSKK